MPAKTLTIGSWSSGSMRTEDWADAALAMAQSIDLENGETRDLATYTERADESSHYHAHDFLDGDSDDAAEALNTLIDTLSDHAPIYCYVGSAEGDGADFGVWIDHDALTDALTFGVTFDEGANGARSVFVAGDNVIIDVSDHGNIEVYAVGRGESLLAAV